MRQAPPNLDYLGAVRFLFVNSVWLLLSALALRFSSGYTLQFGQLRCLQNLVVVLDYSLRLFDCDPGVVFVHYIGCTVVSQN